MGLLLLRIAAGASLILGRMLFGYEVRVILVCVGISLLLGLWTPIVGSVAAITEMLMAFLHPANSPTHILLATVGLSLALLGPGAWSIDARIFGRKRIDIKAG